MLQKEADLYDADVPTGLTLLLERCASGDAGSLRELYDEQAARLYGIALRIVRQPALAADVVHDSFVSIWQFAGSFDPGRGSPEAWLTSIVRHRALDLVRRRGREISGGAVPEQGVEDPDPLARLVGTAEGAALYRCLDELDEDKRSLIGMAFIHGCSHTELAERLGIPLGTVQSSIYRGLASLRRCLEP
jgi:RNA polymerase sigma-70 factor (ECF subfamily)